MLSGTCEVGRQFDVSVSPAPMRKFYPHLIVLQHDSVKATADVIVAPLVNPSFMLPGRINPLLELLGQSVVLQTANLTAVPRTGLKRSIANLAESRSCIIAAIDLLFAGN